MRKAESRAEVPLQCGVQERAVLTHDATRISIICLEVRVHVMIHSEDVTNLVRGDVPVGWRGDAYDAAVAASVDPELVETWSSPGRTGRYVVYGPVLRVNDDWSEEAVQRIFAPLALQSVEGDLRQTSPPRPWRNRVRSSARLASRNFNLH